MPILETTGTERLVEAEEPPLAGTELSIQAKLRRLTRRRSGLGTLRV